MPRIMLVDDDYTMKLELEAMLTSMGYDVVGQADSGDQAIEMARDLKPDVILMDIVMPGHMDGISAAEKIRLELDVAIVFLTGYGDPEYVERARQVEPFGYVMKPFTEEEIRASVEIALYKNETEKKLKDFNRELIKLNRKLKAEMAERSKCNQEVRESEKKYRGLFENSLIGISILDEERNVLECNDAMLDMHGYKREDLDAIGNTSAYYDHPEDREKVTAALLKNGFVKELEVKLKRKDGTPFDALLSMRTIKIAGQSLWQVMIQDISDRKWAERELQKSRREWEGIFQAIGHPTLILNADQRLAHANKATEKATGKSEAELIGKSCYEIFHHTDEPPEGCPFKKMIASGHLETVEMEIEALGGVFLVSCTPMVDDKGRIEKVIHIATDITEQKEAEAALKASEEKYRDLVENMNEAIFALDTAGTVTYISPAVENITGYLPSEAIGKNIMAFIHPDDRAALAERLKERIQSDHIQPREYRLIHKTGEIRWIRSSSRPIVQNGKTVGVRGVFIDITQSKRLEEQLRQAHKMEAIATLTGGIAHDYNNLLAVIMGNLSLAREEAEPHSLMVEFLRQAEQASSKAKDLTHQLMILSRGGYPMKERGSIERLLKAIQGEMPAHESIEYGFFIQDDLWPVEYDSRQMHFAIKNVLINAVEAMPRGGKITVQAENQVIEAKGQGTASPLKEGKYVRISIKDEGKGIPEEHLDQIFDPYFSTKERGPQKGMGLGLTTAYAVVQKHGGRIMINSTIGVGTTVTIYLPASEGGVWRAERDDVKAQSPITNHQSTIQRILVMDDEESLRTLTLKMLEWLGYEAETVKDGVEAIETYKKHMEGGAPFDAVILDLTIKGGMGGDQAIKELIKIAPDVKAIVCSGYFNDPVLAHCAEHGFCGAMAKPYQMKDLERVLKEVLD